jgi:hypothetical protein
MNRNVHIHIVGLGCHQPLIEHAFELFFTRGASIPADLQQKEGQTPPESRPPASPETLDYPKESNFLDRSPNLKSPYTGPDNIVYLEVNHDI